MSQPRATVHHATQETSLPGSLSPHPPVSRAQPVTPRLDAFLESPYLPGLYTYWSSLEQLCCKDERRQGIQRILM